MEPQRLKQDEPAKQGRRESIVTKKPLENQTKNKSDKHNRTKKKTAEKKNMRRETTRERERDRVRERERQKRKAIAVNQKFVIIDNDF